MPTIQLAVMNQQLATPVTFPDGSSVKIPIDQYRCLIRLPSLLMPRDAVIDTGAPLTCVPQAVWRLLTVGVDFEWLPFGGHGPVPTGSLSNWQFTFRMARFLGPLSLLDNATTFDRPSVIAQFAGNDPPTRGNAPPSIIIGLWGGVLEGGRIAVGRDPLSGHVTGAIEFP